MLQPTILAEEDVRLDPRPVRWRIALIALATDHTTERDFARMSPSPDLAVYTNRIAYANPTTPANLAKMQPRLTDAAWLILPEEPLDAIAFACTAASVVIGDDLVTAALNRAKPGVPSVTPTTAAFAAFAELGMKRVSVLTPYTPVVSKALAEYFTGHGFEVCGLRCFGLEDDRVIARVVPSSIVEAAVAATDHDADGLFISCTALRAAEKVDEIEARIGRPVVTSNQAMFWRAARLAGCDLPIEGHGRLARL